MPPRQKITKDEIIAAAVGLVRSEGESALNARRIAAALGCSTQPIFSNFASMDELRLAVADAAEAELDAFIARETKSGRYPPYKASGMAYIRFAREEKELFKLLYMRDRTGERIPDDTDLGTRMETLVQRNTGLADDSARLFHLEMWAYVHGIAVMLATNYLTLDEELVSRMVTDCYQGFRLRYGAEEKE